MSRLDGQKKSSLPLIIALIALVAVGAGGYTFYAQNRGTDTVAVAPGEVEMLNTKSGGLGVNGKVDVDAKPAQEGQGNTTTKSGSNNAPATQ
jgi:hypothetical protein